jgi:IclR family pca regulon transcriptional regulator
MLSAKNRLAKRQRNESPAIARAMPLVPGAQIDALNGDPNFMTSLARGLAVVEAFSNRKRRMTISQLSIKTGFSRAAVRRCLYTLVKLGLAGTDENRHFYLCPRILSIGYSYISSMPLSSAAQPVLEHVVLHARESCWIGILDGDETVCVAHVNASRIMAVDVHVGIRMPAFSTSVGRVLLANLPPDERESCIMRTEFRHISRPVRYSPAKVRQVLNLVRQQGYSVVDQELEVGVWAVAVPIYQPCGRNVGALGIAALAQRDSPENMLMKFLPRLQEAAKELSMLLK